MTAASGEGGRKRGGGNIKVVAIAVTIATIIIVMASPFLKLFLFLFLFLSLWLFFLFSLSVCLCKISVTCENLLIPFVSLFFFFQSGKIERVKKEERKWVLDKEYLGSVLPLFFCRSRYISLSWLSGIILSGIFFFFSRPDFLNRQK